MSPRPALTALVLAAGLAAAVALSAGDGKGTRRGIYLSTFPAGAGREIADRACLMCHSAALTTQQAKDSTGWEKTLGQMQKWGVVLTPAEHDTLRQFLVIHFGPRPK